MAPLPHRIRQQRWRVQARSPEEAFALRQRVREALEGALLPAFERAFDEAAPGDGVVHVPRLELHLRIPGPDALAERLSELVYQQVREQLGQAARSGGLDAAERAGDRTDVPVGQGGVPGARAGRGLLAGAEAGPGRLAGAEAGSERLAGAEEVPGRLAAGKAGPGGSHAAPRRAAGGRMGATDEAHAWIPRQLRSHYLETGSLPWFLAGLERDLVLARLRPEAAEALEHVLARPAPRAGLEAGEVAFYFRLLQLLPVEQWALVATGVSTGDWGAEVVRAIAALAGEGAAALSRDARLLLAAVLLAASRTRPEGGASQSLVPHLVRAVGEGRGRTAEALTSPLPEAAGSLFRRWLAREEATAGSRPQPETPRAAESQRSASAEPFLLPVSHVGLLLLHPYLPRFFESTGVKEAKRAELPADRLPRAAALLHLLAVGEAEVHEFELDFIKLLLGLTPDAPLPVSSGLLQPSDHEEAGALLQAVIEHWKALKNTSVQGLRASFLRRRGFVREHEQGLRLQVEPAAFDILLGAIPWGIGTVKLPWMRKPIFTEWPTP